ncbi:MAG TPA: translation initiation factor IF-1 [Bryobacteraceae bacterium]|nr:translation initiation factor IF-1 [Bryobacteraceae bacterium]
MSGARCQGSVVEELPQLVFRVDLGKGHQVLAHAVGMTERNFVRLLPGDKVEVELANTDVTRGRILRKL